ncbi:MAG: ribbon-helix-helix domain-containing protein [Candidatus Asgardarchaeum sp.]
MSVIPVKLDKETIKEIDNLVKQGIYKSRNEAIRKLIAESLRRKIINLNTNNISKIVKGLLEKRDNGQCPIIIVTDKTAEEIISEGRDRLEHLR